MKKIKLTRNKYTIVDDEDYEILSKYKWYCTNAGYAQKDIYKEKKKYLMHRVILNAFKGEVVDHINGNPLDNRKQNLRKSTQCLNTKNVKCNRRNNTSGYKGVSFNKKYQKWEAYITFNYKHIFLGYFDKKNDAGKSYNNKAKELFGEYSNLNKII